MQYTLISPPRPHGRTRTSWGGEGDEETLPDVFRGAHMIFSMFIVYSRAKPWAPRVFCFSVLAAL